MTPGSTTSDAPWAPRLPWYQRPRLLERVVLVIMLTASATELCLLLLGQSRGGYLGILVTVAGILLARRWLWIGLVVTVLGPLTDAALGFEPIVPWTIVVFTAFSVTVRGLPAIPVGVLAGLTSYLAIVWHEAIGLVNPTAFTAVALSLAAAAAGSAIRSHEQYWLQLSRRAQDAVAARELAAERRVTEERLRIARDLHDVVGHEIAVLGIHLGVAEVNLPGDAAVARDSLDRARGNVQSILGETQRILHVLRTEEATPGESSWPTPGLEGIPGLVDAFRRAGAPIESELAPVPEELDREVSTAAFRVVQEALTNAQKHGAGEVWVSTTESGGILTVTVSNAKAPGRRAPAGEAHRGLGIVGMRERAASAGGRLEVRDAELSFTVTATLRVDGKELAW